MSTSVPGNGLVYFIGGGPGAPDLLTLRAARAIAASDVVIWGRPFLMDEVATDHARPDAELLPWPPATMAEILAAYDRARSEGLVVARLYSGDPTLFGKLREEIRELEARGVSYEIVPGVSALGAAGAAIGQELTAPEGPRALIIAGHRKEESRHPSDGLERLAAHGANMVIFMADSRPEELQRELLAGGYTSDTPCAVVHRATWPDELVVRCQLGELGKRMTERDLERLTLVVVGRGVSESAGGR